MLQKFKLPIVILVIVVLNQAAGYAVHAAMPETLLASGTTRYAVAQATGMIYMSSTSLVDTGLSKTITIPAGKTGDVMVFFCANTQSQSYAYAYALVGSVGASPGLVQLRNHGDVGSESQCVNFYRLGVPAGTKTVKIQWKGYDTLGQWMYQRSMIVIVNIH